MSRSWLSPSEFPLETEHAIRQLGNRSYEVCFHGKVRTGKTRLGLKRLFGLHFQNYGMTSGIVRKNNVDMNLSIRPDIRELSRYSLTSEQSPIVARGGHNFTNLYLNGGECRIFGLNNEDHILGTKYDVLFLSQLDQITEAEYEKLLTRLTGTAIRDENGQIWRQIISDMNPSEPDSFMYEREAAGLLQVVDFDFVDNPDFFRGNRWTEHGYHYVKDLRKRLTGLNYDRYYLGRRVSAQGAVFQLDNCHFIETLPDLWDYHKYIAIDWGWQAPSVVLWIAWNHATNDVIVYREWRTTGTDTIRIGNMINHFNEFFNEKIEAYIIDRDKDKRSLLRQHCNISAYEIPKAPGSRLMGYNHIHHALKCKSLEEPGGLSLYRKMMFRSDVDTLQYKGAENLIKELRTVKFHETRPDEITKENDHGPDALAGFYLWKTHQSGGLNKVKGVSYSDLMV